MSLSPKTDAHGITPSEENTERSATIKALAILPPPTDSASMAVSCMYELDLWRHYSDSEGHTLTRWKQLWCEIKESGNNQVILVYKTVRNSTESYKMWGRGCSPHVFKKGKLLHIYITSPLSQQMKKYSTQSADHGSEYNDLEIVTSGLFYTAFLHRDLLWGGIECGDRFQIVGPLENGEVCFLKNTQAGHPVGLTGNLRPSYKGSANDSGAWDIQCIPSLFVFTWNDETNVNAIINRQRIMCGVVKMAETKIDGKLKTVLMFLSYEMRGLYAIFFLDGSIVRYPGLRKGSRPLNYDPCEEEDGGLPRTNTDIIVERAITSERCRRYVEFSTDDPEIVNILELPIICTGKFGYNRDIGSRENPGPHIFSLDFYPQHFHSESIQAMGWMDDTDQFSLWMSQEDFRKSGEVYKESTFSGGCF